jgi:uncharacterized damage-inducible protein DinB
MVQVDVTRIEPRRTGPERLMLDQWVDYHRATLLRKCAGLSDDELRARSAGPSSLSLLGLVRHMTEVEHWFGHFDGRPFVGYYSSDASPDGEFDDIDEADVAANFAAYVAQCERSRAAVIDVDLDTVSPNDDDVSLRWIYLHMIEEYARHNGHADLLRERIDGATGD